MQFWDRHPIWFTGPLGKEHPSRVRALEIIGTVGKILEIGCGNGVDFAEMLRRGTFLQLYCAIDVTKTYIDYLTSKYPKSNRYEFIYAGNGLNHAASQFPTKYFDVAYARRSRA